MKRLISKGALLGAALTMSTLGLSGVASAAHVPSTYATRMSSLNNSGSTGTTYVTVNGDQVRVTIKSHGLSPGLPHAQHIHIGGNNTCPDPSADMDSDGLINTVEGQPSYGEVQVSLTTEGDVSAASGLAVDRFPVAAQDGSLTYSREFALPAGVTAADVAKGVIVQHGISELFNDRAMYDGEPRSSLNATLPLEASIPTNCGELVNISSQMVSTGVNGSIAAFGDELDELTAKLAFSGDYTAEANAFSSRVAAATDQLDARLIAATIAFNTSAVKNVHEAKDRYVDVLGNVRAAYFNELEAAKNDLAAQLSNKGHDANVVKDGFIAEFSQLSNAFSQDLEQTKNSFINKINTL